MVTTRYEGRLGNNLFQYTVARVFAERHQLPLSTEPVNRHYIEPPHVLDFSKLFYGKEHTNTSVANNTVSITDDNIMEWLVKKEVDVNLNYYFSGYFQSRDVVLNLYKEMKALFIPNSIKPDDVDSSLFDQVLVCVRLNDIANSNRNLPLSYYETCLDLCRGKRGYITSDSPDHTFVTHLRNKYHLELFEPGGSMPHQHEGINRYPDANMNTLLFCRNFNHIVSSGGSFNFWVALLSGAENVLVPQYKQGVWYGDIFCLPNWTPINYN
jgi:hypothetical protein